jgi:hypothetical protein
MTVRPLTRILTVALALVSAFAAWSWLRPYEWKSDPVARFQIRQARVTRDHSNYWVDVFLKGPITTSRSACRLKPPMAVRLIRPIPPSPATRGRGSLSSGSASGSIPPI